MVVWPETKTDGSSFPNLGSETEPPRIIPVQFRTDEP